MLNLNDIAPIAVGGHRTVYPHPERKDLCVKVLHEPWQQINRRLNDPFRHFRSRRHFDENRSEAHELERLQRRLGGLMAVHFPKLHGLVDTDLGEGLVVERVSDQDGKTSITLKNYLWLHGLDGACTAALDEFWAFLFEHRVAVRDPMPHNLAMQRLPDNRLRVVMIDGFGSSDFLPFRYWIPSLAVRKLQSRRNRTERRIKRELDAKQQGKTPSQEGMAQ